MGRSLSYPSALEDTLGTNNLDGLSAPTIRVLDIGAGPDCIWLTRLFEVYPHLELHALDSLPPAVIAPTNITYHQSTAPPLPFPDAYFHFVHCRKVLSSTPTFAQLMREAVRVLKLGELGVWVEGRNAVSTATNSATVSRPGGLAIRALAKENLARRMIADRVGGPDLEEALPKLLLESGLENVRRERLECRTQTNDRGAHVCTCDGMQRWVVHELDGVQGASGSVATMVAFFGRKK